MNDIEEEIADIWQDLLGIEKVGVKDNFFDLGGDSLLLVQVHRRLREVFTKEISIADLFKYPNIKLLAHYIVEDDKALKPISVSGNKKRLGEYEPIAIIGMACRFPVVET